MGSPKRHRQADLESLLGRALPQGKDAQTELQVQLCGVPVQAVSGLAFCAGAAPPLVSRHMLSALDFEREFERCARLVLGAPHRHSQPRHN